MGMSENSLAKGVLWLLANEDVQLTMHPQVTIILCVLLSVQ